MSITLSVQAHSTYNEVLAELIKDRVASSLAAQDNTLWGSEAADETSRRLAWVRLPETSRSLILDITELRKKLNSRGLHRVALCGMGGSSLAPEVMCRTAGVPLRSVDSSDPDFVRAALAEDLTETIVVVSSKSGSTVETDSQRRVYEAAFVSAGLDPRDHIVVVTDAGTTLDSLARTKGYVVFNADPMVGGRYSALSAFGLVPSGLAGVDIAKLLDEAQQAVDLLSHDDPANPALQLGALIGAAHRSGVDKIVIAEDGSGLTAFGDWAEQLIAESTGKRGRGALPVLVPSLASANATPSTLDEMIVALGLTIPASASGWAAQISAPLGEAFQLWEHAIAIAGRIIGINPFDQPNVESAKAAARSLLLGDNAHPDPLFTDGTIDVYATPSLLSDLDELTVATAIERLTSLVDPVRGYLAVMAFINPREHSDFASVREAIAAHTGRPTTFGWGPRFLHSTGQYHKGGSPTGVFLQITTAPEKDLAIPGRPFTFGTFIQAQAVGDARVLEQHDRPVLRFHLRNPVSDLARLRTALDERRASSVRK